MGLFDQILGAINNPSQQASSGQLVNILNTVQQLSNSYHTNPSTMQSLMSIVGNYVRSGLQQKRSRDGYDQTQAFVNQYSGASPNPQAVSGLFSQSQIQQLAQFAAQRTGLNPNMIVQMLPILVPVVLNLLQSGSRVQNAPVANTQTNNRNTVLDTFLDANGDGEVDIADAIQLAGRYLGQSRF
ncbi:DUF937 domain-containing protein [Chroogloeocystis siderophila]|jgi:hypothetical protein|uniref:DUF937 domain-containing protein n=1 Tax=Chroogloeocystis siderophila 5.2 s.c.1 TaxID=247279 RepID=A0A1U7I060_9CHRO|nr:DUF937 domain-containing protein [Chroogloeocystis siderophila]OKH29210.1 hypothetical protein NIES1031_01065 [Chroogloeocystis siderophila 5.2 s.c.1]